MTRSFATAGFLLVLGAAAAFADTVTGYVSDDACGAKHAAGTQGDHNCAASCIKGGGSAVLVVGEKVYKIDNQASIKGHEGSSITVNATLTGDTIHIDSVK